MLHASLIALCVMLVSMAPFPTLHGLPFEKKLFCLKNEVQTARMRLETSRYHQGSCAVDDYVDEFKELIDLAGYEEGANIVLKFCHGLNPEIQRYIACLTSGRPDDDEPEGWYEAAVLCDDNRIANDTFQATFRTTKPSSLSSSVLNATSNTVRAPAASYVALQISKQLLKTHRVLPTTSQFSKLPLLLKDLNAMDIDAT